MIEAFTSRMDFEAFREDPRTAAAVERKLQIISEAAIRLGAAVEIRCPGLRVRSVLGHRAWKSGPCTGLARTHFEMV